MQRIIRSYKDFFTARNAAPLAFAIFFLIFSLFFQFRAGEYTNQMGGHFLGDMVLDNIPTIDLSVIIVEGAFLTIIIGTFLVLSRPRYMLFAIKTVALFIVIRSIFISMTHIGIYPNQIIFDGKFSDRVYETLNLQAGFFFSGHMGLPLLMGLIFWRRPVLRWSFIILGIILELPCSLPMSTIQSMYWPPRSWSTAYSGLRHIFSLRFQVY